MRLFFSAVSFLFSLEGEWEALSSFSSGISENIDQGQGQGSMYTCKEGSQPGPNKGAQDDLKLFKIRQNKHYDKLKKKKN